MNTEKFISIWLLIISKKDKKKTSTELDMCTYVQDFLYQPALEFGKENDKNSYKNVFHKPTTLFPYLKMFVAPNDSDISVTEDNGGDEGYSNRLLHCKGIQGINLPR